MEQSTLTFAHQKATESPGIRLGAALDACRDVLMSVKPFRANLNQAELPRRRRRAHNLRPAAVVVEDLGDELAADTPQHHFSARGADWALPVGLALHQCPGHGATPRESRVVEHHAPPP